MRRAASHALRNAARLQASSARLAAPVPAAVGTASRSFSTSSPSRFFFRRPTKTASDLARDLLDAKDRDRPDVFSRVYPQLVEAAKDASSSSTPAPLSPDELRALMRFAVRTRRFQLCLRIYNDMTRVFGFRHSLWDHNVLLQCLVQADRLPKALEWVQAIEASQGYRPTASEWNIVLQGFRRKADLAGMQQVVARMRDTGVEPNVVTYNTLISAAFDQGHLEQVRDTVRDMRTAGVEPDLTTDTALLVGFLEAGELGSAREVQTRLRATVEAGLRSKSKATNRQELPAVNALIKYEAIIKGLDEALALTRRFGDDGLAFDAMTLNTLFKEGLAEVETAAEGARILERIEDAADSTSNRRTWALLISRLANKPGGATEALEAYQLARDRGLEPDSGMVQPLLDAMLDPSQRDEHRATVKALYDDLSTSSRTYATAPDVGIFSTILRACADSEAPDLEWSRTVVKDMRSRGVALDGPTASAHIIALMRASATYDEAFQAYDEIRALGPSVLDLRAYNAILGAFTSLPFSAQEAAPPKLVMEILSDMRKSNHPPNSATYSLLLTYYACAAPTAFNHVAHLHSLIKLDSSLDPDTALFNSLFMAYSRTGATSAAYRIWDTMLQYTMRSSAGAGAIAVDSRTLSILFDTCGHDGTTAAQARARRVWADLDSGRLRVERNLKVCDSYVEALCRFGALDDAEAVVFHDMDGQGRLPRSGVSTVEALLKFARKDSQDRFEAVSLRIQAERGDLWEGISPEAKQMRRVGRDDQSTRSQESQSSGFFSSSTTAAETLETAQQSK
ncbi:hypothetical protein BMF94_2929 [Rhodotorula taiwanensis]|uniref:Pentacotripeptide-repeat region of PRORP domain-containing protein n=1 Tax=Rhodotorula taiwanensis TaxID=741276 RepID=A0A2S5BBH1_9BASI|nr:hypothetical protein BMF94_2929 [Rhodotorula taiwanensis]